jgi:hypothetical protein
MAGTDASVTKNLIGPDAYPTGEYDYTIVYNQAY